MRGGRSCFTPAWRCSMRAAAAASRALVDVASTFRQLDDAALEAYLERDQPYDCAGSVKIETLGIALFTRVASDDPTALIGLPLDPPDRHADRRRRAIRCEAPSAAAAGSSTCCPTCSARSSRRRCCRRARWPSRGGCAISSSRRRRRRGRSSNRCRPSTRCKTIAFAELNEHTPPRTCAALLAAGARGRGCRAASRMPVVPASPIPARCWSPPRTAPASSSCRWSDRRRCCSR